MKAQAAVMTQPGAMEIREFEVPPLASEAMLIRIDQTGVCGTDRHMYEGHMKVPFPVIPGHEFTGTVVQIGKTACEATTVVGGPLQEGDRVAVTPSSSPCGKCYWCLHYPHRTTLCPGRTAHGFLNCEQPPHLLGGFAEYLYLRPRSWLFKVPDGMDYARAVLAEPAAVALRAVERAFTPGVPIVGEGLSIGQTALVLGCGPVGLLVVAALKHLGLSRILAVDRVTTRLEAARQMGADVVLDARQGTPEERKEQILALTEGVGANVVFEAAGAPAAFQDALDYVCRGGILIEIGHFTDSGGVEIRPHQVCHKDLDIRGVWAYPIMQFREALQFLHQTPVPVEKLLTHTFSLAETEAAIRKLFEPEGILKPVVKP